MENLKLEHLNIDISSLSFKDYWGPDRDYVFDQFKSKFYLLPSSPTPPPPPHKIIPSPTAPFFSLINILLIDLPFAPFNKLEKIGKVCDFPLQLNKAPQANQTQTSSAPNPFDEEKFVEVGNSAPQKKKNTTYKRPIHKPVANTNPAYQTSKTQTHQKPTYNRNYPQRTKFKESILIKSDWTFINDVMKTSADKTFMTGMPQSEILAQTGSIKEFDIAFEKTDSKIEKPIPVKDGPWVASLTTTSDNLFLELIEKDTEVIKDPVLYATDSLLISLMTLRHSNFPWEMIVTKNDNFIVVDKPEKAGQSYIDLITTNENTSLNLPEEEKVDFFFYFHSYF